MTARAPRFGDPVIDEHYVIAAAQANGLPLAPAQVPGIVATLQRIEAIAEALDGAALGPDDEAAPVWMP